MCKLGRETGETRFHRLAETVTLPFVKLDTRILQSTLWFERDARELFITALLMAEPREILEPVPQLKVDAIEETGFTVPPGWYGFVPAAGVGIIRQAGIDRDPGIKALTELGSPDKESRSSEYGGRRLVRVNGGYVILNYIKYRERDVTSADRNRRWRQKQREEKAARVEELRTANVSSVPLQRNDTPTSVPLRNGTPLANVFPERLEVRGQRLEARSQSKPKTLKSNSEGSRASDDDCEKAVREIAALYPKIRDADNLSQEIQYAIAEAIARDGRDLVWMGTKSMAEAVARWPKSELKFIPAPGRFFRESQYKTDPAEWVRSDGNGNAANPGNRDRAPSKQVERAFGNLAAVATVFGGGDRPTAPAGGAGVEHPRDHAGAGQAARHGAAPAEVLGGKTKKRPG